MSAKGFAVVDYDTILVSTVSLYRRATIVNFLVAVVGMTIQNSHTDEQIESIWQSVRGSRWSLHEVDITLGPKADKQ